MIQLENLLQKNAWYSAAPQRPTRKLVSATLKKICCEQQVQEFGRLYPHLGGLDFIRQVFAHFDFRYDLNPSELERIPRSGPLVIVSNHPLGSLDGLALIDMVARVRKDVRAIASQLLWNIEPLRPTCCRWTTSTAAPAGLMWRVYTATCRRAVSSSFSRPARFPA
ncbi:GNAT family N-acetyltransferase [Microbulbifer taiwanensis]|uniref:GNAT family N-acetyltransferase n=1 Tax=Microbulbifer taiwanensis TaxID=986746 RepID=UPI0036084A9C